MTPNTTKPADSQAEAVTIDSPEFVALKNALIKAGVDSTISGAGCDVQLYLAAEDAFLEFIDAKLAQASAAAEDFRHMAFLAANASRKAEARATAAEAQLEAIRHGIKSLQQYWIWDGHLCETQNQHPERAVVRLDKVLAILQQQPQADESGLPG